MIITNLKSGYFFSRNPILARLRSSIIGLNQTARLIISKSGQEVYEGRISRDYDINISEIIDAYVDYFPEPMALDGSGLTLIRDLGELGGNIFSVYALNSEGDDTNTLNLTVFKGGISKHNHRKWQSINKDVFTGRFFNQNCNFFFTTRTEKWIIYMRETELAPLYFFCPQSLDSISIKERINGNEITYGNVDPGLYALDLGRIRYRFFSEHDVLPSQLDIYIDGQLSTRIVVELSDNARERYLIKYRNSLGFFEVMEAIGKPTVTCESGSDDTEAVYRRYDISVDDFVNERSRVPLTSKISINTGVKYPREFIAFLDLMASDEVYLIGVGTDPVRVIPSCENMQFDVNSETPTQFDIVLEPVEQESNFTTPISNSNEVIRGRIFSYHFSNHFN